MISRFFNPLDLLNKNKSILLFGPRETGKTVLIKSSLEDVPNKLVIDLLRGDLYRRYLLEASFLEIELKQKLSSLGTNNRLIVAIDEVQKIPALLDEVHRIIENYKNKILFLLTGSSASKLKRGGANLLAGRAITKHLYPISQLEVEIELYRALKYGTLPHVYFEDLELAEPILDTYVSTYLREEIQQESLVRGVERFSRFLEFAAQLNGEPINFSKLGKQIGAAGKTALEYYGILVDTLIANELPAWSQSVKKQLLKSSKYYFFDCGVLNALNGYLRVELRQNSFLFGKLFETFIINQIISANDYLNLGLRLYYWRDKNNHEVDLIIARNSMEPLLAVEIKSNAQPDHFDCTGFKSFSDDYPKVRKICICTTPNAYEKEKILFIPWQDSIRDLKKLV